MSRRTVNDAGVKGPIAFYLPSLTAGGAERVMVNLAQGIAERGLPVDLVVAAATGDLLDGIPAGVQLVDLRAGRVLPSLIPLAGYLRRVRPRVLISSMAHANLVALWAARMTGSGTPVIATVHTTVSLASPPRGRITRVVMPTLIRSFYPWAHGVVAVSRGAADDFARQVRVPRDRIRVIYNPVITPAVLALSRKTLDHPWFVPAQPPVILGVGRLTAAKDFPTLIKAFAELRRQRAVRLMILGEGEERPLLEALIQELGVSDDVGLPGYRDDAPAYMAASALFVLSSLWEGLPTVLVEALAAGTRVISTDCPSGPREILQDGRLGTLVPPGDPQALAQAMSTVLDRPRSAVPLEALTPFTREAAVDHYLSLIESAS